MTAKKDFLPYEEAAAWARSMGIKSFSEWAKMLTPPSIRPDNIPSNPNQVYREFKEKKGWGGFLGTGVVAPMLRKYRSYEEAVAWSSEQNFSGQADWLLARRETPEIFPDDIPACPNVVYDEFLAKGGWGVFLGTGTWSTRKKSKGWVSFDEAMAWGRENGILTAKQWSTTKRPQNVPSAIDLVYPEEFSKVGGWTGFLRGARSTNTSVVELLLCGVLNDLFGCAPDDNGRIEISDRRHKKRSVRVDWVDRNARLVVEYDGLFFHKDKRSSDNLKTLVLLSSKPSWNVVRIRPLGLEPIQAGLDIQVEGTRASTARDIALVVSGLLSFARAGKIEMPQQTQRRAQEFLDDKDAAKNLLSRVSLSIPLSAKYIQFEEARIILSNMGIATVRDFERRCRADPQFPPPGIPRAPATVYPDFIERGGWSVFLGTQNRASRGREWRSYSEAAAWAQSQGLKTMKDWISKCQEPGWLPLDIPSNPQQIYKDDFYQKGGSGVWLGTGTVNNRDKQLLDFDAAADWAQKNGIKSANQWLRSKDIRPTNIPSNPSHYYPDFFDRGGWAVILGKAPKIKPPAPGQESPPRSRRRMK